VAAASFKEFLSFRSVKNKVLNNQLHIMNFQVQKPTRPVASTIILLYLVAACLLTLLSYLAAWIRFVSQSSGRKT
jgi:hypothetical protein